MWLFFQSSLWHTKLLPIFIDVEKYHEVMLLGGGRWLASLKNVTLEYIKYVLLAEQKPMNAVAPNLNHLGMSNESFKGLIITLNMLGKDECKTISYLSFILSGCRRC